MEKMLFAVAFLTFTAAAVFAGGAAEERVDYETQVKPLLAAKCYACHGALKRRARLRLDAAPLLREGGRSGPVVVPGDAASSLLIQRVAASDPDERMPPQGEGEPLTAGQIELLSAWIEQGAETPEESVPPDVKEHWAYRSPVRLEVSGANPIDAFLEATHAELGVTPAGPASKQALLRRVYLDLVGLPPTRAELHAFLDDPAPDAYEKLVDRLLQSPRHAERWARHWMDIWRYSDWTGYGTEIRYSQRHLWRWRDWIVESLDADKGYDAMVLEMLAADELYPAGDDAVRATGFLARHWYKFDRDAWLDETVEHTFKAFLGMTVNCARCHDHKYDPVTQEEYYRARAIFEPYDVRTDRVAGELDVAKNGVARIYDARPDAATYFFERGDPKRADKSRPVEPGVPAILGAPPFDVQPVSIPATGYYPALRDFEWRDLLTQARGTIEAARGALSKAGPADLAALEKNVEAAEAKLAALKARWSAENARYLGGSPRGEAISSDEPPGSHDRLRREASVLERNAALLEAEAQHLVAEQELVRARSALNDENEENGDDSKTRDAVTAAEKKLADAAQRLEKAREAIAKDSAEYTPLGPVYPPASTGRRLALARWIVHPDHPLTARVAVNHIWLRHFGQPLVEKIADFGLRSPRPLLADLLDRLAADFKESGWSMKRLHRLIVTSAAYRRRSGLSGSTPDSILNDRENRTFWHMNPRRMEAEVIRDAILHVAGSLDVERGGPEIDQTKACADPRRSLYFRHARQRQVPFLELFDAADPRECYRRRESVRPQQAFALVNSPLVLTQSRLAGRRLGHGDEDAFLRAAFEAVLSRPPDDVELRSSREFLERQRALLGEPDRLTAFGGEGSQEDAVAPSEDADQRARENLILVLFNHHEFVTVR